jgi:hypothetical protein
MKLAREPNRDGTLEDRGVAPTDSSHTVLLPAPMESGVGLKDDDPVVMVVDEESSRDVEGSRTTARPSEVPTAHPSAFPTAPAPPDDGEAS